MVIVVLLAEQVYCWFLMFVKSVVGCCFRCCCWFLFVCWFLMFVKSVVGCCCFVVVVVVVVVVVFPVVC